MISWVTRYWTAGLVGDAEESILTGLPPGCFQGRSLVQMCQGFTRGDSWYTICDNIICVQRYIFMYILLGGSQNELWW